MMRRQLPRKTRNVAAIRSEHKAAAADAPFDLRNGDEAACSEIAEQDGDRGLAGQLRRLLPILADPRYVDVRDEIVGVGAREHEYLDRAVGLGSLNQRDQIAD